MRHYRKPPSRRRRKRNVERLEAWIRSLLEIEAAWRRWTEQLRGGHRLDAAPYSVATLRERLLASPDPIGGGPQDPAE